MVEAADRISVYLTDVDRDSFGRDSMVQDAVIRNLSIVGEAAKKASR